jgi:multimeric flavodoxin WrbA
MIRAVGIMGSPQSGGNTERLLARFLSGVKDAGGAVHEIAIAELDIRGWMPVVECQDRGGEEGTDDFERVSQALIAADVIAVASPVYFRNVPAQLKALIDRGQCQWIRKYVDKEPLRPSSGGHGRRRGILIAAGGNIREHFRGTIETIKSFLDVYEADYWGELLFGGVDAAGDIEAEPLALQEAYDLGFRAVAEPWEDSAGMVTGIGLI